MNRTTRYPRRRPVRNAEIRYEQRKKEWTQRNPTATPKEYEQAMLKIARELGL